MLLLAPPFDTSTPSPGYIQGYVPGVRENGGQYTHAAMWAAMAFAALGDGTRAWALFELLDPLGAWRERGAGRDLQGRAVRRGRRRLRGDAARRPRRLDLVHRLGRLDATSCSSSRCSALSRRGDHLRLEPLLPRAVARVRALLPSAPFVDDVRDPLPPRRGRRARRRSHRRRAVGRWRDPAARRRPDGRRRGRGGARSTPGPSRPDAKERNATRNDRPRPDGREHGAAAAAARPRVRRLRHEPGGGRCGAARTAPPARRRSRSSSRRRRRRARSG